MTKIVNLEEVRRRLEAETPPHPVQEALDALALALIEHGHQWTDRERQLYENALTCL